MAVKPVTPDTTVETAKIIVPTGRYRKVFQNIEALAVSISQFGLLIPITITEDLQLVDGERRLRACKLLGLHSVPVRFLCNLTPLERKAIEVEANVQRDDFTWQERVLAYQELFDLRRLQHGEALQGVGGGYGLKNAAEELGVALGTIGMDLQLAKALSDPDIANAKTKAAAYKLLREKEEAALQQELARRVNAATQSSAISDVPNFVLGDARIKMRELASATVDLVLWDPPYGKDWAPPESIEGLPSKGAFDDSTYNASNLIEVVLSECFRVMKPSSVLLMFFDPPRFGEVKGMVERAGLTVCPYPLLWCKTGGNGVPTTSYYYSVSTEGILHAVKGKKDLNKSLPNFFVIPRVPSNKKLHPHQKPQQLLRQLIENHTLPGELVIDPTAGSGSVLEAAFLTKRAFWGCELDPVFHSKGVLAIRDLITGKATPLDESSTPKPDFRQFVPGTADWMQHWQAYPEDQKSMVAWQQAQKNKEASKVLPEGAVEL